jgi:predicted component of type VI protein secretion system
MQEANQRLNETQLMAELTGKLPDGTPTTAEQQRQLQNLWTVADATGTIPDALADMYKLPRGMQTQAAKEFARRIYESDRDYQRGVLESDRNYELNLAQERRLANEANESNANTQTAQTVSRYIDGMVQKDDEGAITNLDTVRNVILNSGLDSYNIWLLYQKYGIPWPKDVEIPSPSGN